MDLKKQGKGQKLNYEDYEVSDSKNNNMDIPQKKDITQTQQAGTTTNQQNSVPPPKKEIQISQQTKERADACKLYIESIKF